MSPILLCTENTTWLRRLPSTYLQSYQCSEYRGWLPPGSGKQQVKENGLFGKQSTELEWTMYVEKLGEMGLERCRMGCSMGSKCDMPGWKFESCPKGGAELWKVLGGRVTLSHVYLGKLILAALLSGQCWLEQKQGEQLDCAAICVWNGNTLEEMVEGLGRIGTFTGHLVGRLTPWGI